MPIRKPNEDLFEETRMSFGEHLEELRKVLVRSLYGVAIGCIAGFILADNVVEFLQTPLKDALTQFKIDRAKERLIEQTGGYLPPELVQRMETERLIPLLVQVDPGQLVRALRTISPNALEDLDVTPYRFTSAEIKNNKIGELAQAWVDREGDADVENVEAKLELLWRLASNEQRQIIEALSAQDSFSDADAKELVEILNSLIEKQDEIFDSDVFAGDLAKPEESIMDYFRKPQDDTFFQMKERLDASGSPDLGRRINHLMVSNVFKEQLNPPTVPMVPIEFWQTAEVNPQSLTATEVFMIWVKAGVITGLFIASPWVFFQLWSFVAAGLYKHEQRYVYLYLPFSLILFFGGAALSFFFVFKPVLSFLFEFNAGMGIDPQPRIGDWLSFVMFLPLGFGIAFQLPLVMLVLNRIGIFPVAAYTGKWRVAVLVIFVVSMLLTPADPISLLMLAAPLTLLYFLGIALCLWMPRGRNPFGEVYEPS